MSGSAPLVSAIMPTRGRGVWACLALRSFLSQTYLQKELVILDDADARSFPIAPTIYGVRYVLIDQKLTIGAKRNMCCREAAGEIIMHWDDDDWSAPDRMYDQVERLRTTGKAVTGYRSIALVSEPEGDAYKYIGTPNYVVGTSLAYRRDFWKRFPFGELNVGEDNEFVFDAVSSGELVPADGSAFIVARIHAGNTSKKDKNGFTPIEASALPQGFRQP